MNTSFLTESMIRLSSEVLLCSGENNPNIHLIDPKTSGILESYSGEAKIAKGGLAVSEKFGNILAHQNDKTILIYFAMGNKKPLLRVSLPEKLSSFCFSPDEYSLYGGGHSGLVYVWDCITGHLLHKFQAHHKSITKILATSDGGTIITAGEDYTINTWNVEQIFCRQSQWNLELHSVGLGDQAKIKPQTSLIGHTHYITDIKISKKRHGILASSSIDKTCRIWNYSKGVLLMMIPMETPINCLAMDPFEDYVFLGCKNHNIYACRITQEREIFNVGLKDKQTNDPKLQLNKQNVSKKAFVGHKEEVTAIVYYQEENMIISGGSTGKIIFWDLEGNQIKQINILTTSVNNIYIMKRPYEFEKNDSFLKQKKRPFEIAILRKHEEEKPSMDSITVPLIGREEGDDVIVKKVKRDGAPAQTIVMQYIKSTFPFFETKGKTKTTVVEQETGKVENNGIMSLQEEGVDIETQLVKLKAENEKLLKMNEKLFGLCFVENKI